MRYYGNKAKLLDFILENIRKLDIMPNATIMDGFSGTGIVGQFLKKQNYRIISNDFLYFSYILSRAKVTLNSKPSFINLNLDCDVIDYLNNIKPCAGFITYNYSPYKNNIRQYFSTNNASKIDAIRQKIYAWKAESLINQDEEAYLICSLLTAISLVSNISGTYGSYLKTWDNRALKEIRLSDIPIFNNAQENIAVNLDITEAVDLNENLDLLYLDPPYNSRQYASNYFLLELIAEGWFDKEPMVYGHTGMRPYDHQKSKFCSKKDAFSALAEVISKQKSKNIMISYNDEGIIPLDSIEQLLKNYGKVNVDYFTHKRYRSIGQDGSKTKTKELLITCKIL